MVPFDPPLRGDPIRASDRPHANTLRGLPAENTLTGTRMEEPGYFRSISPDGRRAGVNTYLFYDGRQRRVGRGEFQPVLQEGASTG